MSQIDETIDQGDIPEQDERAALEARAKVLNISYHTNISTEKLR